jgi:putative effector of murein hydrolase
MNVTHSTAKIVSHIQSTTVLNGMVSLILIDKGIAFLFKSKRWAFPSALAAMIGIFLGLCDLRKYAPKLTDKIADGFSPSVSFIKAWLPLFFVPPLVVLPLKMYLLKGVGFQMVGAIISGAFLSLLSAGLIADISGKVFSKPENLISPEPIKLTPVPALPSVYVPAVATAGLLLLSKVLPTAVPTVLPSVIQTAYGATASITGYIAGTMLPTNMKKIAHPVLTCAVITIALLSLFGICNGIVPAAVLTSYFGANSFPGAGNIISSMLGPAIISFGIQLYQYRIMLRDNAPRVLSTTLFSAGFGLTSSAILAKVFKLAPAETALSLLTRCITTPLALAGSMLTGADPSLTAFVVVVTGVLGASLGESFLELIGIKDPISVGLSMGASAHGLGTAAVSYDPVKFAAAVVSMTLTGLWTVVFLSLKPLKTKLVKLALF